jgi:dTDP-4-amino-4,6-dideoxygalactose transaminase
LSDRIPFVDLAGRHGSVAADVERRVLDVLRSGRYIGGPVVAELEAAVARQMGRAHGVGVGSGTDGLTLALAALGVGAGDEVIIPAVSFVATATAVLRIGAVPVVVDVQPDRPLLDPRQVEAALTERTRAVVVVHLFGDEAPSLRVPVPVIDDAAQAFGADPPVGTGSAAVVSFYPTKVLGGAGDGGMVVTDDLDHARAVRRLGDHGRSPDESGAPLGPHSGTNSRLDAIQAAVLLGHLGALGHRMERRRAIAARFDAAAGPMAMRRDEGSPITVYALRHPDRAALISALDQAGIDTRIYYPCTLAAHPSLAGRVRVAQDIPNGASFCAEALALPCYAGLSDEAVDRIGRVLEQWA